MKLGPEEVLAVHFLGPRAIAAVNAAFVGHEGPTDVIAFDYRADGPTAPDDIVAEIMVCPDIAAKEARKRKKTVADEIVLYLTHGMLHLSGEDDLEPAKRRRMRARERVTVRALRREFDFARIFVAPETERN